MDSLTVSNFRCFRRETEIPIRPLTLLVGENSTGKSSVLAAIRIAWAIARGNTEIDFNSEPFLLGTFDDMMHSPRGRRPHAKRFTIGSSRTLHKIPGKKSNLPAPLSLSTDTKFHQSGSQPAIARQTLQCADYTLIVEPGTTLGTSRIRLNCGGKKLFDSNHQSHDLTWYITPTRPADWEYVVLLVLQMLRVSEVTIDEEHIGNLNEIRRRMQLGSPPDLVAFAPIRSRPQRTYDPITDAPHPEGAHVPMMLARLSAEDHGEWERLSTALREFGSESGMFEDVQIRRLGRHPGDPFQVMITIGKRRTNLADVGYGVSQILPLLVHALQNGHGGLYLIQQPEVHLHPRAQAALGSLFVKLARHGNRKFVIETHSDYLIDRVRIDIRDKPHLFADDVAILYFSRRGPEVSVFPIAMDEMGNFREVPKGYREFFLDEQARFLGAQK